MHKQKHVSEAVRLIQERLACTKKLGNTKETEKGLKTGFKKNIEI